MDSSTQASADDANDTKSTHTCICSELFELVEKQQIQLNEKDNELQQNRRANEELLANMDLEKTRAIQAATDNFNTELASAQQTIRTLQMAIWKSLTLKSADLCYYIEVRSEQGYHGYLYSDNSCSYLSSGYLANMPTCTRRFKFTNNSDGTHSIYSTYKGKYLQAETNSHQSTTAFTFSTNTSNTSKFVLFYDQQTQNKQPGILVDIYSLENGFFLSVDIQQNPFRVVANSHTPPAKKFLLVPVE